MSPDDATMRALDEVKNAPWLMARDSAGFDSVYAQELLAAYRARIRRLRSRLADELVRARVHDAETVE